MLQYYFYYCLVFFLFCLQSDYEGQIQTLISYVQSVGTVALVVAGGSGTLLEVPYISTCAYIYHNSRYFGGVKKIF